MAIGVIDMRINVAHDVVGIQIVTLAICPRHLIRATVAHGLVLPVRIEIIDTLVGLVVGQSVLRAAFQRIGCRKNHVEVTALMVIEREIHEGRAAQAVGIDETSLVETHRGCFLAIELRGIFLRDKAEADARRGVAEKTDTSRVGRDCRDISAQRIHRSTHAHITGRTIQITAQQAGALIRILCSCRQGCCQH